MSFSTKTEEFDLDPKTAKTLIEAACDRSRISGLTHKFYRYPARFSPAFAREFIKQFSRLGDLVYDPFMGGGATLVEASANGRMALGTDISNLADFVSDAKTTLLNDKKQVVVQEWLEKIMSELNIHSPIERGIRGSKWVEEGYLRNLGNRKTWRLRKLIEQALLKTSDLPCPETTKFAHCLLLKSAQWALDGRKTTPSVAQFRRKLKENLSEMLQSAAKYREQVGKTQKGKTRLVYRIHSSAIGIEDHPLVQSLPKPKLVLTSPPYPGVHVLYHRWQVDGRKETPAPFWIANKLDGAGLSYYTMGDRKQRENKTYFERIAQAYQSIAKIIDRQALVVQMVAFAHPEWQLEKYLESMAAADFAS